MTEVALTVGPHRSKRLSGALHKPLTLFAETLIVAAAPRGANPFRSRSPEGLDDESVTALHGLPPASPWEADGG